MDRGEFGGGGGGGDGAIGGAGAGPFDRQGLLGDRGEFGLHRFGGAHLDFAFGFAGFGVAAAPAGEGGAFVVALGEDDRGALVVGFRALGAAVDRFEFGAGGGAGDGARAGLFDFEFLLGDFGEFGFDFDRCAHRDVAFFVFGAGSAFAAGPAGEGRAFVAGGGGEGHGRAFFEDGFAGRAAFDPFRAGADFAGAGAGLFDSQSGGMQERGEDVDAVADQVGGVDGVGGRVDGEVLVFADHAAAELTGLGAGGVVFGDHVALVGEDVAVGGVNGHRRGIGVEDGDEFAGGVELVDLVGFGA